MPKVPDVELTAIIGQGGMGAVYKGRQTYIDRDVAVKVMRRDVPAGPTFAARFQREAAILAGLTHPNIVSCYHGGTTEAGEFYLVMEFVGGPNVSEWLEENGRMEPAHAVQLCRELCSALKHAQASSIIHRDVKCANVLLRPLERAEPAGSGPTAFPFVTKLADLGLARAMAPEPQRIQSLEITTPGTIVGSPGTMAPEQFNEPDSVDHRADIYGLGCVIYHALTGRPAFLAESYVELLAVKGRPVGPNPCDERSDIPAAVGQLVVDMLAGDREARPQSYSDIIGRCDQLLARELATQRKTPWLMAAGGVVLTTLVILLISLRGVQAPSVRKMSPIIGIEEHEVVLTAEATGGQGPLLYRWSQISGPHVGELPQSSTVRFIAPNRSADYEMQFTVSVRDGAAPAEVTESVAVSVSADNDPPLAEEITTVPKRLSEGQVASLIAAARDPEGEALTFLWSLDPVVFGTLTANGPEAEFTPSRLVSERNELTASLRVSDGEKETTRRAVLTIMADPRFTALAAGKTVELIRLGDTTPDKFVDGWSDPVGTESVWGAVTRPGVHGVNGLVPEGEASRSYPLPRGNWKLSGGFATRVNEKTSSVCVRVDLGPTLGYALTMRKEDDGRTIAARRQSRSGDGGNAWVDLGVLTGVTTGWRVNQRCDFEFQWDGRELTLRWSASSERSRWRRWSEVVPGTPCRPVFAIAVTEGFGEFYDLELVGTD